MHTDRLLDTFPIISDQVDARELKVLLRHVEKQLLSDNDIALVEFGCYIGTTSLFIRRLLNIYAHAGPYHVYDSFEGLPEKTPHDASPAGEQFKVGELQVSKKNFLLHFKKADLRPPYIHKGWFHDLSPTDIPDTIGLAFLDGDYYESIMTPLQLIWPKLHENAVIIVDDYANEALPGAKKAVDEWLCSHPASLRVEQSLAIITAVKGV